VWVLGVTAAIYNPIIRVHLTREIWSVLNVGAVIVALMSVGVLRSSAALARGIGERTSSTCSNAEFHENRV
jgi:hypothetical protein